MELRQLRYFLAVAEELHFRHAAELVHVAQPALSQQIRQLEEEIGVTLFERSHHKVQLTAAGKAFYERARAILNEASLAILDARKAARGEAGTITIGFVSTAAIRVLPAALKQIREQVPAAEIELRELSPGEQIDCLHRKKLDIGFFHAKLTDDAFETRVVARDRLILALPETSRYAACQFIDLKMLASETAIVPAPHPTPGYWEQVRLVYELAGVTPERVHHTRLIQTGLLLVGAGLGVSIVPESFRNIQVTGVVYRPLAVEPPTADLIAAWRRDNVSPLLARLIQALPDATSPAVAGDPAQAAAGRHLSTRVALGGLCDVPEPSDDGAEA